MKRKWPYLFAVPIVAVAATVAARNHAAAVATVGPGEIRRRIVAIGVEVPKHGVALIRARTAGTVRAVYVAEGAVVRQGQLLAALEDTTLMADLRRSEAQRDATAQALAQLTQGARKDERAAADADADAARVEWAMAEDRAKRQALLGASGPEAATAQARWEADLAKSRLDAAQARRNLVQHGAPTPEVRAARFKLEEAQAVADAARAALERTRLVAPVEGTVLTIRAHEGDSMLGTGSDPVLFEIANLSQTELRSEVDADDASSVQQGQRVKVLEGVNEVGSGVVTRMSQALERRTNGRANSPELNIRNVWVDVHWLRGDRGNAPMGAKFEVEIELPAVHAPAVVPRSAVTVRDGATTIAVWNGIWPRPLRVELGAADDRLVQVLNVPTGTRFRAR